MTTCISCRPPTEKLVGRDELLSLLREAADFPHSFSALNVHCLGTMDSFVVVTEYDSTARPGEEPPDGLEDEEPMEPCEGQPVASDPGETEEKVPLRGAPEGSLKEPGSKLNLSSRKLSLQERSQSVQSPGSNVGVNGRYIYPSLPYSPVTSPHSSPRLPRRPTIESHRVSITGLQVREAV